VDSVYASVGTHSRGQLLLASFFYSFQIYCDFSGYSDIAIGAARVMGFKLMDNFNAPYAAKSIPDFWRRWHISLSTWFKDYVYFSLGGNRVSVPKWYFNIMLVFIVSGLWHGASWNFIIWGFLHGIFQLIGFTLNRFFPQLAANYADGLIRGIFYRVLTFSLVSLAWVFFRLVHFSEIKVYFKQLVFDLPSNSLLGMNSNEVWFSILLVFGLYYWDFKGLALRNIRPQYFVFLLPFLVAIIYFFGVFSLKQFIYFQF
jgi:D-alanyl-lipoteichoic acid acyltransferase DltB (MBOAT superfamily)